MIASTEQLRLLLKGKQFTTSLYQSRHTGPQGLPGLVTSKTYRKSTQPADLLDPGFAVTSFGKNID